MTSHIQVFNAPKRKTEVDIIHAASFAYKKLFKNKTRTIELEFDFVDMHDSVYGYFAGPLESGRWPSCFGIELSKDILDYEDGESEIFKTVFHEMVHVYQSFTGQLCFLDKKVKYKKRIYNIQELYIWELPWEQEAYALEQILYDSYFNI